MKWLLVIGGIFIIAALAVLIVGLCQPVKHSVTRSIYLKQTPAAVFALLDNMADAPTWASTVLKVEPLPSQDGNAAARYTLNWGGMKMIMTQLERTPPSRLVTRMAAEGGPVFGTWTYQLAAENGGCRVTLTEDGELNNPIYRAMSLMRSKDANIAQTLHDLAKKFGESAEIQADR